MAIASLSEGGIPAAHASLLEGGNPTYPITTLQYLLCEFFRESRWGQTLSIIRLRLVNVSAMNHLSVSKWSSFIAYNLEVRSSSGYGGILISVCVAGTMRIVVIKGGVLISGVVL